MKNAILGIVAVLAILISLGAIISEISEHNRTPGEKAARDREGASIATAAYVARRLKSSMRDPESFTLSSVLLIEKSEAICYEYRARNGFGGVDVGHAVLSSTGKLETNESGDFLPLWHKECAHKLGVEEAAAVVFLLNHPPS